MESHETPKGAKVETTRSGGRFGDLTNKGVEFEQNLGLNMKHLCLTVKMIGHGDLKYKNGIVMGIPWGYDIANNKIQVCPKNGWGRYAQNTGIF